MQKIESILVAVHRGESAREFVGKAVALARLTGARLELFHCDSERAYFQRHQYESYGVEEVRESCLAGSRAYLEDLSRSVGGRDITIGVSAACESPWYEAIIHAVRRLAPSLVVLGFGAKASDHHARLDANDWEVVRTCPAPLLLTQGGPWRARPVIAAAVDISGEESPALTQAVLRAAGRFVEDSHGSLEILHAGRFDRSQTLLDAHRSTLEERARYARVEPLALHLIDGEPAAALPAFAAARRYDLIVLGALTHRKALTALVGTLTSCLIETIDSDFLLVRPALHGSPVTSPRDADA